MATEPPKPLPLREGEATSYTPSEKEREPTAKDDKGFLEMDVSEEEGPVPPKGKAKKGKGLSDPHSKLPLILAGGGIIVVAVIVIAVVITNIGAGGDNQDLKPIDDGIPAGKDSGSFVSNGGVVTKIDEFTRKLLPLKVVSILPSTGSTMNGKASLALVFSRSVIALGSDADYDGLVPPLGIVFSCAQVPGRWRWVSTSILRFDPEDYWPNDLSCALVVKSENLTAWDGAVLDEADPGTLTAVYTTPHLSVSITKAESPLMKALTIDHWDGQYSVAAYNWDTQWELPSDANVHLTFSHAINHSLVSQYIKAAPVLGGASLPFVLNGTCSSNRARCIRGYFRLSDGARYSLQIPADVRVSNYGGKLTSVTETPASGLLPFTFLPLRYPGPSATNLALYLRHGLSSSTARSAILAAASISPSVTLNVTILNEWTLLVTAGIVPGTQYTLNFAASNDVKDGVGQSLQASSLAFTTSRLYGSSVGDFSTMAFGANYWSSRSAYRTAMGVDRTGTWNAYRQKNNEDRYFQAHRYLLLQNEADAVAFLTSGVQPLSSGAYDEVNVSTSTGVTTTLSASAKVDKIVFESGEVFGPSAKAGVVARIEASTYSPSISYVTHPDIAVNLFGGGAQGPAAWVNNVSTATPTPIAGARVLFFYKSYYSSTNWNRESNNVYRTDTNGFASSTIGVTSSIAALVVLNGVPVSFVHGSASSSSMNGYNIELTTDRPLYRVGETIKLVAVIRKKTATGSAIPATLSLGASVAWKDQSYSASSSNKASTLTVSTNSAGVGTWDLTVPADAKYGPHSISVTINPTNSLGSSSISVLVSDPRIPTASVDCSFEKEVILPNSSTPTAPRLTCTTKTYVGVPIAKASVKLTCTADKLTSDIDEAATMRYFYTPRTVSSSSSSSSTADVPQSSLEKETLPEMLLTTNTDGEGSVFVAVPSSLLPVSDGSERTQVDCVGEYISPSRETLTSQTSTSVQSSLISLSTPTAAAFVDQPLPLLPFNVTVDVSLEHNQGGSPASDVAVTLYNAEGSTVVTASQPCVDVNVLLSPKQRVHCPMQLPAVGTYKIAVSAKDVKGNTARAFMLAGWTADQWEEARLMQLPSFKVSLEKNKYRVGESIRVQFETMVPQTGFLLFSCSGGSKRHYAAIVPQRQFTITLPVASCPVTVESRDIEVALQTGKDTGATSKLNNFPFLGVINNIGNPRFESSSLSYEVDRTTALTVGIAPGTVTSSNQLPVSLSVKNTAGNAVVKGEAFVFVVDKAVLDLSPAQPVSAEAIQAPLRTPGMQLAGGIPIYGKDQIPMVTGRYERFIQANPFLSMHFDLRQAEYTALLSYKSEITQFPSIWWWISYTNDLKYASLGGGMPEDDVMMAEAAGGAVTSLAPLPRGTTTNGGSGESSSTPAAPSGPKLRATEKPATLTIQRVSIANGAGSLTVPLGDYLGTWDIRVLAISEDAADGLGVQQEEYVVSKSINTVPSCPRVVRYSDTFTGGVVLTTNDTAVVGSPVNVSLTRGCAGLRANSVTSKIVTLARAIPQEVVFNFTAIAYDTECFLYFDVFIGSVRKDALGVNISVLAPLPRRTSGTAFALTSTSTAAEGFEFPPAVPRSDDVTIATSASHLSSIEAMIASARADLYRYDHIYSSSCITFLNTLLAHFPYFKSDHGNSVATFLAADKDAAYAFKILELHTTDYDGLVENTRWYYAGQWINTILNAEGISLFNRLKALGYSMTSSQRSTTATWNNALQQAYVRKRNGKCIQRCYSYTAAHLYNLLGSQYSFPSEVPKFDAVMGNVMQLDDTTKARVLGTLIAEMPFHSAQVRQSYAFSILGGFKDRIRFTGRTAFIGFPIVDGSGQGYPLPTEAQCHILTAFNYYAEESHDSVTLEKITRSKLALYISTGGASGQSYWWFYSSGLGIRSLTLSLYDATLQMTENPNLFVTVAKNDSSTLTSLYVVSFATTESLRTVDTRSFAWAYFAPTTEGGLPAVAFRASGEGEAVITLTMNYIPTIPAHPNTEYHGLLVQKVLRRVFSNGTKKLFDPDTENLNVGDMVEVLISVTTPDYVQNVFVTDYLPGGVEAVDTNLGSSYIPGSSESSSYPVWWTWWWWYFASFKSPEFKKDQVTFTASYLSPGTYDCTYYARAVTSGDFVLPGAHSYLIEQPEVGGSSPHSFVTVNARSS